MQLTSNNNHFLIHSLHLWSLTSNNLIILNLLSYVYLNNRREHILLCGKLTTKKKLKNSTSVRIELTILRLTVARLNQLGHEVAMVGVIVEQRLFST